MMLPNKMLTRLHLEAFHCQVHIRTIQMQIFDSVNSTLQPYGLLNLSNSRLSRTCQKGNFVRSGIYFVHCFVFWRIKILEPSCKKFLLVAQ